MCAWSKNELSKIAKADDLHIAPYREDGVTAAADIEGHSAAAKFG